MDLAGKPTEISEFDVIKLVGSVVESFTNTTNMEKKNDSIVEYGLTALSKLTVRFSSSNA